MTRPLIGITCRLEPRPQNNTAWHYLQREYSQAIWDTGGLPVLVPTPFQHQLGATPQDLATVQ